MLAEEAYALSKSFTKKTVIGLGAIKGANCIVKSTEHKDGQTIVTFEWTSTDGSETKETTQIAINDGTPIYNYTPGDTYHYGDLCLYSGSFFRCIHEHVAPATMVDAYWDPIGNADGNYGMVDTKSSLPSRYTPADRKLFYVIDEARYYLWNGLLWEPQEEAITNEEIDALFG